MLRKKCQNEPQKLVKNWTLIIRAPKLIFRIQKNIGNKKTSYVAQENVIFPQGVILIAANREIRDMLLKLDFLYEQLEV